MVVDTEGLGSRLKQVLGMAQPVRGGTIDRRQKAAGREFLQGLCDPFPARQKVQPSGTGHIAVHDGLLAQGKGRQPQSQGGTQGIPVGVHMTQETNPAVRSHQPDDFGKRIGGKHRVPPFHG